NVEVTMLFQPSGHVGGDLVGYFRANDDELGVYSVDVSGHGVASALMTARVASFLSDTTPDRNIALRPTDTGYQMIPLPDACRRLNSLLQSDHDSDQYLTMCIAQVNTATGHVSVCQAGHPSPVVQRADGSIVFHELFSTPIGLIDDAEFASLTLELSKGDRLFLYSDGLTECHNLDGALLDEDGLAEILHRQADLSGPPFVTATVDALLAFNGQQEFPDDLSAVLIERV
ncbi:MAG: serine/threonine-protein phosphatase, partial [Silicimonas sp.]|nr:serine/threonine-protein phosphatase [Silicimonas sp.]